MISRHYLFKLEMNQGSTTAKRVRLVTWNSWRPEPDQVFKYVNDTSEGFAIQDMQRIK